MEVRGSVADRPWGATLGAIALRRHTGQLTVECGGKRYCVVFQDGAIVAATSPLAADSIARVALTNHFITSTQVAELTRRLAAAPDRDEVDVLGELIRFTPDQAQKLRHRLVAQRAARTFSIERGEFVIDDRPVTQVVPGVSIDPRHVIYLGARTNLSEQRLLDELRQVGSFFVLRPEAIDELPRYGFEPAAQPVLDALKAGTSLPELEAAHRDLDPRFAQAIIYALVSSAACVVVPRAATQQQAVAARGTGARDAAARAAVEAVHAELAGASGASGPVQAPRASEPAAEGSRSDKLPGEPPGGMPRPAGSPAALAMGTATYPGLAASEDAVAEAPAAPPSPPPGASRRTMTPAFPTRVVTASPTSYAAAVQDEGTNTPAALRARTRSDARAAAGAAAADDRTARTATPTAPALSRAATPPAVTRVTTPPVLARAATPPAVTRVTTPPALARTATSSTPPAARGTAPTLPTPPGARPTGPRGASTAPPGSRGETDDPSQAAPTSARPIVGRTVTPSDAELRGFGDQRTPGFGDQRTPTGQRTPAFGDQRTPTSPPMSRTPTGGPAVSRVSTDNIAAAEEAFRRGELAMKRDLPGEAILEFKAACDLNPQEIEYGGMLAWAKFCAAGDKAAIGAETRKALERVVYKSNRPERARFYLGRVERMLGRDREALRHFQEVLDLRPNHADAQSEIRAIEARLAAAAGKTGLFGRKR